MNNLDLYNNVRKVPEDAQKKINGGRLNGKTDINPMWRIKTLTEQFGPCGFGWYYEITKQWLEQGSNNEVAGFCNINLYIKNGEEWSKPIPGTGGSGFITKESKGLYTSDEVFKMALTDAISVACKALGFGADIYWSSDKTKYDSSNNKEDKKQAPATPQTSATLSEAEIKGMEIDIEGSFDRDEVVAKWNKYKHLDEQCNKRLTKTVQRVCDRLGITE